MNPIITTKPPLVIKVFKTYFNISATGKSEKEEDNYEYKLLESVKYKKGKFNLNRSILDRLAEIIMDAGTGDDHDSDEFIIEFITGESESRYLHGEATKEHLQAIKKINDLIVNGKT